MGKATYIGTVVANSSQEEAITSFLKTINRTNTESKAIFSISASSDRVFLTSLTDLAKPFSPLTGKLSPVLRTADVPKIAKALSLNSTNEITAKGNFSLQSSQCKHCQSTIVSDNKRLLKFCIVCGSEQEQEDDGEERVLLSIYNDEYEYEKPPVETREEIDERQWTPDLDSNEESDESEEDEIEAMLAEDDEEIDEEDAAYEQLENEEPDEIEELDEEDEEEYSEDEIEAMLAEDDSDVDLGLNEDQLDDETDCDEEDEIEAMLAEDDDESESEESIDESALKEMMNASAGKSKSKSKHFKSKSSDGVEDVDVEGFNEDEIEAMLSGDDEEEQVKNILNDSEFNDVDLDSLELNSDDDSDVEYEDEELAEPDYAKVNDISEDDKLEVDLVEDGLNNSETLANSTVNMLYVPSETVSNHRWYAIVNDTPVAVATVQSVGAQKAGIFATESFRKATEALMAQIGIASALRDMGFKSLKVKLPVKQIVESQVRQAVAEANAISQKEITNMRNDLKAALATASVGINKKFFSKLSNPIKAELYDALSTAGVRNAEILIDDAFCARSDDYHRALIDQAFDLMKKPVEARNEISEAVMSANYQRSSVDETSLSHSVSKQLSSLGHSSTPAQANVAQASSNLPSFNERASMVMRNLVR